MNYEIPILIFINAFYILSIILINWNIKKF